MCFWSTTMALIWGWATECAAAEECDEDREALREVTGIGMLTDEMA